jgi:hypothetical protein
MKRALAAAALVSLACAGPKGDKGEQGDPGAQGAQGTPGVPGAPAPGGNNLILWGSDASKWSQLTGAPSTAAANTTDVIEGDASFEFNVPSGTQGGYFVYGDYIAVDPRVTYVGALSVKLVNGAGDFSAGVEAYDKAKTRLDANDAQRAVFFMANQRTLTTGTWTDFTGALVGEGSGADQLPAGTRFIRPVVFVNRNNIGTTLVDALRLTPDYSIRTIARVQGYGNDQQDNGLLAGRSLTYRKLGASTGLRVTWSDNFRVTVNDKACRWEILFNGAACPSPGGLYFDKYEGASSSNRHDPSSFAGTCFGLAAGNVAVTTRAGQTPGYSGADCYTGWNNQLFSIEVEEVR